MSDTLPRLRPYARQGKAYVAEMKAIYQKIKWDLKRDYETIRWRNGKVVVVDVVRLAIKYQINIKVCFEYLEDLNLLATGTYDALRGRGFRPIQALREVWEQEQVEGQQ